MRVRDIVLPNYGKEGVRTLCVGAVANSFFSGIKDDCLAIISNEPCSNVSDAGHVTNWTKPVGLVKQWSLLNDEDRFDATACDTKPMGHGKALPKAEEYAFLNAFMKDWPWAHNFRLNLLGEHSSLGDHKEQTVVMDGGEVKIKARFHLPIESNLVSFVNLDGQTFRFNTGMVYFFNNGCVHSSVNQGVTPRIHLVWDCFVNADVAGILRGGAAVDPVGAWPARNVPSEPEAVSEAEAMKAADAL